MITKFQKQVKQPNQQSQGNFEAFVSSFLNARDVKAKSLKTSRHNQASTKISDNSSSNLISSKNYSVKIHKSLRICVAICDSNLIGKKFEEGKKQLDIRETFYKGEEVNREELIKLIKKQMAEDATFNIVGKESVQASIEAGLITKEAITKIKNIPFALTLL